MFMYIRVVNCIVGGGRGFGKRDRIALMKSTTYDSPVVAEPVDQRNTWEGPVDHAGRDASRLTRSSQQATG